MWVRHNQNGSVKGNIFLGQYCFFVPPWNSSAVVDGKFPTWIITFCLPLFLLWFKDNLFFTSFPKQNKEAYLWCCYLQRQWGRREIAEEKSTFRARGTGPAMHAHRTLNTAEPESCICTLGILPSTLTVARIA